MIYYLLCFLAILVLFSRLFFKFDRVLSAFLYLFVASSLILAIGCHGNDVVFRYLPWIERLSVHPGAYNRWGELEVVVGLSLRYLFVWFPGLDACSYLTLSRLIALAVVPFFFCFFRLNAVSVPLFLSTLTACYLSVPFILALSNTIFQGYALIFMVYFLSFYECLLLRKDSYSPGSKLLSVVLCIFALTLMALSHSSGLAAVVIIVFAIFIPFDFLQFLYLVNFSLRGLKLSKKSLLVFVFMILSSLSLVALGNSFITSKVVDSTSIFYFGANLVSYVLFCRNRSLVSVIKLSGYLQFVSFLLTLFLVFQGLLLYFGTPSERFGMYFSVCFLAACFSVVTSVSRRDGKVPFDIYVPLMPVVILFLIFPFLPSFSNLSF